MPSGSAARLQAHDDYSTVSESPEMWATADQLRILYTRYQWAQDFSVGKDVLEVACGGGMGLGYLAQVGRSVTGGDITEAHCEMARRTYRDRPAIQVKRLDAQKLPFADRTWDIVICFEALYYFPDPEAFLREAWRVLRPGGKLLISVVNPRWDGFCPSRFSVHYFDASALAETLSKNGFEASLFVGFPATENGLARATVRLIRMMAVKLGLIPASMKQKQWLKRVFYGKLERIPIEITRGMTATEPLIPLQTQSNADGYRFIFAIASRLGPQG